MPVGDLRKLWRLHLVDAALYDIRARAAALDPGKKLMAQIQEVSAKMEEVDARSKQYHGELTDLELSQKSIDEKLKKMDADIYGGKVVNPREIENLEKEIETLKKRRSDQDTRLLQLMEVSEPLQTESEKLHKAVDELKSLLAQHQKAVLAEKTRLEAAYKEQTAARPNVLKEAPPAMLARYDLLQKKHGTAMALITKQRSCEACGLNLSEKTIESAKEDRMTFCEQCHRMLYYTDGVV